MISADLAARESGMISAKFKIRGNSVIQLQTQMLDVLSQTRPPRLARMAGGYVVNNCSHQTLSFASGG
jgi:hypothetical protein